MILNYSWGGGGQSQLSLSLVSLAPSRNVAYNYTNYLFKQLYTPGRAGRKPPPPSPTPPPSCRGWPWLSWKPYNCNVINKSSRKSWEHGFWHDTLLNMVYQRVWNDILLRFKWYKKYKLFTLLLDMKAGDQLLVLCSGMAVIPAGC